jgi:cytidyltransferase-like protein
MSYKNIRWNNKFKTAQMLGRFQPWHQGHQLLFKKILKMADQVIIMVKDVHGSGDNPFTFKKVRSNINKALKKYKNKYKIILVPNITHICYGRTVGYKIQKINLNKKIHRISATKIRKNLRLEGKL